SNVCCSTKIELNIVLLGRSGDGKSSTKNTILGEKSAQERSSATSLVNQVKAKNLQRKTLRIVETPGLFDTSSTKEEFQQEVEKCITHCVPGLHAFIIILKVGRYTAQEARILDEIKELFGEDVLKYAVVLFTNGDQLEDGQTIEEFVQQGVALQELVDKCRGRVHVIDNKYWKQQQDGYRSNRVQVEKLLKTIEEMVKESRGQYYSKEMLQAVNKNKRSRRPFENVTQVVKKYSQGKGWAVVVLASVLVGFEKFQNVRGKKLNLHYKNLNNYFLIQSQSFPKTIFNSQLNQYLTHWLKHLKITKSHFSIISTSHSQPESQVIFKYFVFTSFDITARIHKKKMSHQRCVPAGL
uniref:AIG1-type G domain-containing protein n=1 Tax=Pygocentrus nattereri TaxID=42514 RepID=A0AAR2M2C9_PYGNA